MIRQRIAFARLAVVGGFVLGATWLTLSSGTEGASAAIGAWSTHQHDSARSGVDPDQPAVTSASAAWSAPTVDGKIYAQPLIVSGQVLVATENNSVYSFDVNTGALNWSKLTLAPPVTSGFGCGNVSPTGILGTPVVDTSSGILYTALASSNGGLHYELWGLDINNGGNAVLSGIGLDPTAGSPPFDPTRQQQRGALTLANGRVYVPFGGRWGDCATYRGWVVGVVAATGALVTPYETLVPLGQGQGGGIWATNGATTDASGNLYVATGNSSNTSTPDDSESVIKLSPALSKVDWFTTPEWSNLNGHDTDIGSIGPVLLQNGWLFQSGKNAMGYLIDSAHMSNNSNHVGGMLFEGQVCAGGDEATGAGAYMAPSTVYIACTRDLRKVTIDTSTPGFTTSVLRTGYSGGDGAGPPIVSGGVVWNVDVGPNVLYGFSASTDQQLFAIGLTGSAVPFQSAASGDGHLVVPAGNRVNGFALGPPAATSPIVLLDSPVRLVDTRKNGGPITPGADRCFQVGGLNGIPVDATGVIVNLAAVEQTGRGWLTIFPAGQAIPSTSTLNFDTNQYAIANGAIVRLGTTPGKVCVDAGSSATQVVLDATGYVPTTPASLVPLLPSPVRLVDTRKKGGPVTPGVNRCFTVAGQGGVPGDAAGVLLNMTATGYSSSGWLTLYPGGQSVPSTSTLNFDSRQYAIANNAIVKLGNSQVCVSASTASSEVVLDVVGYLTSSGIAQMPLFNAPVRLVDTRMNGGPVMPGTNRCITLAGQGGIPSSASGIVLNLTAAEQLVWGWLTLYPEGQSTPPSSTLNFDTSEGAIANGTITRVGTNGQVCVSAGHAAAQVIVDASGYLP